MRDRALAGLPSLPPPPRSHELELLDAPAAVEADLARSLAEVRLVNRWLGGTAVALEFLCRRPELRPGHTFALLDVATGSADIPLALIGWARRRGVRLEVIATDVSPEVLECARAHTHGRGGISFAVADATRLPFPDDGFDYVTCNLSLHHFEPERARLVLLEMYRVARRAMLVNDLVRSRPAYYAARALFAVYGNRITSHDGPLSVLRAYTPEEMRELAEGAGLRDHELWLRPAFRQALVVTKGR